MTYCWDSRNKLRYRDTLSSYSYIFNADINGLVNCVEHQDVISVFADKAKELHTTHSWNFMSMENNAGVPSDTWKAARFGEDTIIANLDTGKLFNLLLIILL